MEKRFRIKIRHLTKSKAFYWIVLLLVLLNTVSMSFSQNDQTKEILGWLNTYLDCGSSTSIACGTSSVLKTIIKSLYSYSDLTTDFILVKFYVCIIRLCGLGHLVTVFLKV